MTLDEQIPQAMKDIGFSIVQSGGADTLLLPAFEVVPWHANKKSVSGEGRYTKIEFDEESNTAHLETEDGEISDITVDVHNNVVRTRCVADGNEQHGTLTYERDRDAILWVNRHLGAHLSPMSIGYNEATKVLTVRKEGKEVYSEKVDVPEGVKVEVTFDSFLRVTDQGRKFSKRGSGCGSGFGAELFAERYESDHLLIGLNSQALERDEVVFDYFLSNETKSGDGLKVSYGRISEIIDDLMQETHYDELHKGSSTIDVAGKQLTVFGPNRKGEYRLSSGRSSVVVDPKTGNLEFSGSIPNGSIGTIVSGRLEDGYLHIKDQFGQGCGGGHQLWKFTLNFGNTDPSKSYSAELVEDTHTKGE